MRRLCPPNSLEKNVSASKSNRDDADRKAKRQKSDLKDKSARNINDGETKPR